MLLPKNVFATVVSKNSPGVKSPALSARRGQTQETKIKKKPTGYSGRHPKSALQ
jgi:hypothetical protein